MTETPLLDVAKAVDQFLSDVATKRDSLREEVPGWVLSRASVAQVEDRLAFIEAEAVPNDRSPFILPSHAEAVIAVIRGSVQISDGKGCTLSASQFFVLSNGANRSIHALEYPTALLVMFFRGE